MRSFRTAAILMVLLACGVLLQSCALWYKQQGIDNTWRSPSMPQIKVGSTTEADISQWFGPPSQVIALNKKTLFYYLLERTKGEALILLLFNYKQEKTVYDRAIFFFDSTGVLTEYSLSKEELPFKAPKK